MRFHGQGSDSGALAGCLPAGEPGPPPPEGVEKGKLGGVGLKGRVPQALLLRLAPLLRSGATGAGTRAPGHVCQAAAWRWRLGSERASLVPPAARLAGARCSSRPSPSPSPRPALSAAGKRRPR